MRVIVTRPEHSAQRTASRLLDLGHTPVLLPLSAPSHDPLAARKALSREHSGIAITSAEAIRSVVKLGSWLEPHLGSPLFAVGRMTAAAAQEAGFRSVFLSRGAGVDLADLVASHFQHTGMPTEPLLYLTGRPRTVHFERRLGEHEIRFFTAECYYMLDVDHGAQHLRRVLIDAPIDAVLFYSRETAERFFHLPPLIDNRTPLGATRFLCLSAGVATAVPDELQHNAVISPAPDEDSLLALL